MFNRNLKGGEAEKNHFEQTAHLKETQKDFSWDLKAERVQGKKHWKGVPDKRSSVLEVTFDQSLFTFVVGSVKTSHHWTWENNRNDRRWEQMNERDTWKQQKMRVTNCSLLWSWQVAVTRQRWKYLVWPDRIERTVRDLTGWKGQCVTWQGWKDNVWTDKNERTVCELTRVKGQCEIRQGWNDSAWPDKSRTVHDLTIVKGPCVTWKRWEDRVWPDKGESPVHDLTRAKA